jgi:hypothetical protein
MGFFSIILIHVEKGCNMLDDHRWVGLIDLLGKIQKTFEYVYKGNLEQWLEQPFTSTNPIFSTNFRTLYVPHLHFMEFKD